MLVTTLAELHAPLMRPSRSSCCSESEWGLRFSQERHKPTMSQIRRLDQNLCNCAVVLDQMHRDDGERENDASIDPLSFQKWGNGGEGALFITVSLVISWFITTNLKHTYCSCSHKKIQNGFLSFLLLFFRPMLLNRHKHIGNDLFVFYKFPLPF